jgi:hypothetical protein
VQPDGLQTDRAGSAQVIADISPARTVEPLQQDDLSVRRRTPGGRRDDALSEEAHVVAVLEASGGILATGGIDVSQVHLVRRSCVEAADLKPVEPIGNPGALGANPVALDVHQEGLGDESIEKVTCIASRNSEARERIDDERRRTLVPGHQALGVARPGGLDGVEEAGGPFRNRGPARRHGRPPHPCPGRAHEARGDGAPVDRDRFERVRVSRDRMVAVPRSPRSVLRSTSSWPAGRRAASAPDASSFIARPPFAGSRRLRSFSVPYRAGRSAAGATERTARPSVPARRRSRGS